MDGKPDWAIGAAAVCEFILAAYHFVLPYQFHWGSDSPMSAWGGRATNCFFSALLLLGSIGLFKCRELPLDPFRKNFLQGMLLFWVLNLGFQLLDPMPIPLRLAYLKPIFPLFALSQIVLIAAGSSRLDRLRLAKT